VFQDGRNLVVDVDAVHQSLQHNRDQNCFEEYGHAGGDKMCGAMVVQAMEPAMAPSRNDWPQTADVHHQRALSKPWPI